MTNEEMAACVQALVQANQNGVWIDALPFPPASILEAHQIQDGVARLLGEAVGGFKVHAPAGQAPTRGLIYARMIRPSPAQLSRAEVPHLGIEGEIAFRFHRDLAPRACHYQRHEVADAAVALPVIEVVSGRFHDPRTRPRLEQLADRMINGALVTGAEKHGWSPLGMTSLRVILTINDLVVLDRRGAPRKATRSTQRSPQPI